MIVAIENKDFDQIELPEVLYKYRCWDFQNHLHKRIITHQEVYLASPRSFKDPNDCKNITRYDLLTDDEIIEHYRFALSEKNPQLSHYEIVEQSKKEFEYSLLRDKVKVRKYMEQHFRVFCDEVGILSLTERCDNTKLWNSYSNRHNGICVGFDSRKLFQTIGGGGGKVEYFKKLPIVYPRPKHTHLEQIFYQLFSKKKKWQYENEYRAHKTFGKKVTGEERKFVIPKEAFKEVIIGAKMPLSIKYKLVTIIKENLPSVTVKQAFIQANNMKFDTI